MSSELSMCIQSVIVIQLTCSYLLWCSNLLVSLKTSLEMQDQLRFGVKAPLTRVSTWIARGFFLVAIKTIGQWYIIAVAWMAVGWHHGYVLQRVPDLMAKWKTWMKAFFFFHHIGLPLSYQDWASPGNYLSTALTGDSELESNIFVLSNC